MTNSSGVSPNAWPGLRMGDPMDPATEIAPLANAPHLAKVVRMIEAAREDGAVCCIWRAPRRARVEA